MQHLLLILSTMFSFFSDYQGHGPALPSLPHNDSLGIGLLQVSFIEPIPLYASAEATQPFDTLVIKQKKDGSYAFLTKVLKKNLAPFRLFEGDTNEGGRRHTNMGLIHFPPELQLRVIKATSTHFQVVINEQEKLTVFIRINPAYTMYHKLFDRERNASKTDPRWYVYETWENVLQRAYIVHIKKDIPVFESPGGDRIPFPKLEDGCDDCFHIGEIKGDWAQMIDRQDRKKKPYGWVKWRDAKTLLVTYMEFGYE
ncbi:hypothetical protein [Chitinophaga qingshengii]|uniref:Uncharacterized protein n=1 Tax=Chitinophaga qingshengii TaxID=1569794 RepID=A0ABR7THB4_9BACT|nr:hypothetical protein [Chitinophaga qingshengii]MBC9929896.1 hypothetical protein [Chitinophaga qingshengii]